MLLNLSLFWLIASASLVTSRRRSSPIQHTLCYHYWQDLQNGGQNEPLMMQTTAKLIPNRRLNSTPIPEFKTLNGSVEVSGDKQSACGGPYTDGSISACLWNGGIDEFQNAKIPGWLESIDKRNCFKHLRVNKVNAKNSDDYVSVKVVDACPMYIKPSEPGIGCRELWLTRGAFKAIGATHKEIQSEELQLTWTFIDKPV